MRKIKVVGYIPTDGGYIPLEALSETERKAFERRCVERMGRAMQTNMEDMIDG